MRANWPRPPVGLGHPSQNQGGFQQKNVAPSRAAFGSRALAVALVLGVLGTDAGCGQRKPSLPAPVTVGAAAEVPRREAVAEPFEVPRVRPGQFRVCAFSFNSPYELDAIKSGLSSDEFVFTDLSAALPGDRDSANSILMRGKPGWFADRCRPDLSCDILILSGEFAGTFFGDYGSFVTVQEMEEASCQPRCRGLFAAPREVFLLACNTLATKDADQRTPSQYRDVLLAHGFSQADAERVVATRYGPLGPSFRESLRRTFEGVPRIYGFSSVAPRGEITAPRLSAYFRSVGDYSQYLEKAGRDSAPNKKLLAAFEGTAMVQTTGVVPSDPTAADRALVCQLYDDRETVRQRLVVARELFARPDFLTFVPTIEVFLGRHPPEEYGRAERAILADIKGLAAPRDQITELIERLEWSVLKVQMVNLARQIGWITPAEHRQLAEEGLQHILSEPLSTDVADVGCELGKYTPAGAELESEDIPEQLLWHAEGYRLLVCLAPTDPRITERMVSGLGNIDEATRVWATYALYRRRPLDDQVLLAMIPRLKDPSAEVRDLTLRTFEAEAPLARPVLAAIRKRDPDAAEILAAPVD